MICICVFLHTNNPSYNPCSVSDKHNSTLSVAFYFCSCALLSSCCLIITDPFMNTFTPGCLRMWQRLFWKAGFVAFTWPMLLSELLLMPLFWVRSNVYSQWGYLKTSSSGWYQMLTHDEEAWKIHSPDQQLAELDKPSALPRASVCLRIGLL